MVKYIFLTGGVISSLGKGITSASLGALLSERNIKTTIIKIDGYLNLDAGLMSPYEHGEVFVTDDGAETDLDIGNYERFLNTSLTNKNNITSGKIYLEVIKKERRGEYLGKTVQVIPHVTNEIKNWIKNVSSGFDVSIIEIGGVVGDIESMSFIEAARQIYFENKRDCIFIHLALLPYLDFIKQNKTKPLQHSVKTLLSCGIQPDIIICRTNGSMTKEEKTKISYMTNLKEDCIFSSENVKNKYVVPYMFYQKKLDLKVMDILGIKKNEIDIKNWVTMNNFIENKKKLPKIKVAIVKKYIENTDNYVSLFEALFHSSKELNVNVEIVNISSEEKNIYDELKKCNCVLIPGGWGIRGTEGKIKAVKYARENNIPFLGICLGFQMAVIEYGSNVLNLEDCSSREMHEDCKNPVVDKINTVIDEESNDEGMNFPRKIRVGARKVDVKENTLLKDLYKTDFVHERYRHRYSFNLKYKEQFEKSGLVFSGSNSTKNMTTMECLELPGHKFFLGVQFHPEFKSKPFNSHPIFTRFIKSCL